MIAAAVLTAIGALLIEATEQLQMRAKRFQRFQGAAEGKFFVGFLRPPRGRNRAVWKVDKRRAQRSAAGGSGQLAGGGSERLQGPERFESRQGDTRRDREESGGDSKQSGLCSWCAPR